MKEKIVKYVSSASLTQYTKVISISIYNKKASDVEVIGISNMCKIRC